MGNILDLGLVAESIHCVEWKSDFLTDKAKILGQITGAIKLH